MLFRSLHGISMHAQLSSDFSHAKSRGYPEFLHPFTIHCGPALLSLPVASSRLDLSSEIIRIRARRPVRFQGAGIQRNMLLLRRHPPLDVRAAAPAFALVLKNIPLCYQSGICPWKWHGKIYSSIYPERPAAQTQYRSVVWIIAVVVIAAAPLAFVNTGSR